MANKPYWLYLMTNEAFGPISLAFGIIFVAALIGQVTSNKPHSQIGRRPMGMGLLSYFLHHILSGTGVKGYDSILGAFSPPLRILFHLGLFIIFFPVGLFLLKSPIFRDEFLFSEDSVYIPIFCLSIYVFVLFLYENFSKGVSHPGGPRKHRIQRSPKWNDKTTFIDEYNEANTDTIEWHCDISKQSHTTTSKRFQSKNGKPVVAAVSASGPGMEGELVKLGLSGEPDGRDTWSWSKSSNKKKGASKIDENLVQTMASGGRPKGFNPSVNPNSCDQIFRAQQIREYLSAGNKPPNMKEIPSTPKDAAKKATHFYSMLQTDDGHWSGDYGGPHFLMPGVITTWYIMGKPKEMLDDQEISMMKHYLLVHQQTDGGWGSHIESPSTMFGTVLCYVALRLMGCSAESEACVKGRQFIRDHGGAIMASSWAKFYICVLGCMEWEGHNSIPPEMFLLPNWFPFHPGRLWCHCRMVYVPMSYLYGHRYIYEKAETDSLILSLRDELYCTPYSDIQWDKTRHMVADMDNYSPIPLVMKILQNCLACYENWSIFQPLKKFIRAKGLQFVFEYITAEDLQTNYIDIGPVNKVLNLLSAFQKYGDVKHTIIQNHMMRIPDYLWVAEDGMKMKGYNGSQCWDTSFAIQAIAECDLLDEFPSVSKKVWSYLERTQILSTETSKFTQAYLFESAQNRIRFYRHISAGGWPFSTSAHGWPISDCTAEGLKGALVLNHCKSVQDGIKNGFLKPMEDSRFYDAVNVLLSYQNEDGGWATYENNRGFGWYEQLNPSEVFGDIMIDYSYVECSMASLTALAEFQKQFPLHRSKEIQFSIKRGKEFLKSIQRPDGSWYGSWACCFTYGCWFGIEGLVAAGEPLNSNSIRKCSEFLLLHQRENGGWGEDFTSCFDKSYAEKGMERYGDGGSGVINTAWALLALSSARISDTKAIKRGVAYLMKRQLPSGDWPQEGISGVFNRSIGITYTSYRNVFPIWALGRCIEVYGIEINEM